MAGIDAGQQLRRWLAPPGVSCPLLPGDGVKGFIRLAASLDLTARSKDFKLRETPDTDFLKTYYWYYASAQNAVQAAPGAVFGKSYGEPLTVLVAQPSFRPCNQQRRPTRPPGPSPPPTLTRIKPKPCLPPVPAQPPPI